MAEWSGTRQQLADKLLEVEGPTMDFTLERDEDTLAAHPGTTFSADGVDQLTAQLQMWIASRLFRDLTKNGEDDVPTHRHLRATLTVEIDGEKEPGLPLVFNPVDGSFRTRPWKEGER